MGLVVGVCWYCSLSHIDIASGLLARFFLPAGVFQDFDSQKFSKFFKDFDFQISWSSLLWTGTSLSLKFYWAIPEKIQTGGLEDILFWKSSWNLSFFYFNTRNSRNNKGQPLDIPQNCIRSLGNSKTKTKNPENSILFFLGHSWKFHFIFN